MFFDWKIQLEKVQLTRDLSDNTMIYQGIRLPCKNDQVIATRTQYHTDTSNKCLVSRRYMHNISSSKNTHSNDKIS